MGKWTNLLCALLVILARPGLAADVDGINEPGLAEARKLIQAGDSAQALRKLDVIINRHAARYTNKQTLRVARSPQESMHYALWGALEKQPVKILLNGWAEALYLKSLVHAERKERGAADAALAEALALSPQNARFLLAWAEGLASSGAFSAALAAFEAAEQAAELAPAELQAVERASAIRGSAALLARKGEVEQARDRLRKALAATPNDARIDAALSELDRQRLTDKSDGLF